MPAEETYGGVASSNCIPRNITVNENSSVRRWRALSGSAGGPYWVLPTRARMNPDLQRGRSGHAVLRGRPSVVRRGGAGNPRDAYQRWYADAQTPVPILRLCLSDSRLLISG